MASVLSNLRTDGDRLWEALELMAAVGPGVAGGSNRQTLTDADGESRYLLKRWCEKAGLRMGVDRIGNMFFRREGAEPDLDPVYMGSHLDTQPTGGRYDGVLGVLAALEAMRTLDDLAIRTRRPIVLVNWCNEEGARFAPAMLGSGVFAGVHDEAWAKSRLDAGGQSFGRELRRIGWEGDEAVGARPIHALFELHIEQGPILEEEGVDIGVVTHGQGLWWLRVELTGQESHAGTTPMNRRRDAGLGLARITERVREAAMRHQPHAVGTLGHAEIHPNSPNIIAGRAVATIDIRSPDKAVLEAMRAEIERGIAAVAGELGLAFAIEPVGHFDPVTFDAGCVASVRETAGRLGYRHRDIVSGAGHDACWINRIAPTAMIFCPCEGGLSHNEAERITKAWAQRGADVLLGAVVEAAGIVE